MPIFGFESFLGWFAFFSLIPFILIYLVRPRPKEIEVPSLLFFAKDRRASDKSSFLKRFSITWIFWLHLVILLVLCLLLTSPLLFLKDASFRDHAVIVLDASASMQADGARPFQEAIRHAQESTGKTTTLLLVSNTPRVVFIDEKRTVVETFLATLRPTDTRSNIGDALLLAGDYAKGEHPSITVISDFLATEGSTLDVATQALQAKGISVEFIDVRSDRVLENIGIIHLETDASSSEVFVKNFGKTSRTVDLSIGTLKKQLPLASDETGVVSFTTPQETTEIKLLYDDDFEPDNVAYLSNPAADLISTLLITDSNSPFIRAALTSSPRVRLDISASSSLPIKDYDLYVLSAIDTNRIHSKLLSELHTRVQNGASLIVTAQQELPLFDVEPLLGLDLETKQGASTVVIREPVSFTEEIEFGRVENYFATQTEQGTPLVTAGNSSVIHLRRLGSGYVLYYGLMEGSSDFHLSPSYPLFWAGFTRFIAEGTAFHGVQFESGAALTFDKERTVDTPTETIHTKALVLADVGLYSIDGKKIAANLLSEKESDLNAERTVLDTRLSEDLLKNKQTPYSLLTVLLVCALLILVLEIFVSAVWGDF